MHRDDLLSNTTDIKNHIAFLNKEKNKEEYHFERFLIDRDALRNASYSSKGVYSRAILALFATNQPKDWKFTDRNVIAENFFFSTDKPNLHHIFPTNYIANNPGANTIDNNSLMNIAYLTQITNLEISDKNPLEYICDYDKNPDFPKAVKSHLIPEQILEWSSLPEMPKNALDLFIEQRIDLIIEQLRTRLNGIKFEVIDTRESVLAEDK